MQKIYKNILLSIGVIILASAFVFLFKDAIIAVMLPLGVSGILAYFFIPIVNALEKRTNRTLSILITFAIVFFSALAVLRTIIPMLFYQILEVLNALPTYIERLSEYYAKIQAVLKSFSLPGDLEMVLTAQTDKLAQSADGFVSGFAQSIIQFFSSLSFLVFVPIITFYILKEREKLSEKCYFLVPVSIRTNVQKIMHIMNRELRKFLVGQLTVALIISTLTTIGATIVGLKYSLLLGIIMGVFNMIPFIGPLIGSVPILIAGLTISPEKFLMALLMITAVQQIDGMFITPRIIGNNIKAHPVAVMVCVLAGNALYGIVGMILSLPIFIMLRIIFKSIYAIIIENKLNNPIKNAKN